MISEKRFVTLFLNLWEDVRGEYLEDMIVQAQGIGMTRAEFIELLADSDVIPRKGWTENKE